MREFFILRRTDTYVPTGQQESSLEVWDDRPHTGLQTTLSHPEAQAIVEGNVDARKRHGLRDVTGPELEQLRGRLAQALKGRWRYTRE